MNTKSLMAEARQAVAEASYSPKKLTAIHAGISAAAALVVAVALAFRGKSLIVVALSSSAAVLVTEFVMTLF